MTVRTLSGTREGSNRDSELEDLLATYGKLLRDTIARWRPTDLGLQIDDIEQEVRVRLWRAIRSETTIRHHASFVYRVAMTATIDAIRRVKARREQPLDPHIEESENNVLPWPAGGQTRPDRIAAGRQLLRRVTAALSQLSPDRRRAAGLYLQGLTLAEIASLLSWSEARARNLIYRGLHDLRKRLRAEGIDYE